jgi:hypothetical protein
MGNVPITKCTCVYVFVYYETIKKELNKRLICECRCDERLKDKVERSTRVTYTGVSSLFLFIMNQ